MVKITPSARVIIVRRPTLANAPFSNTFRAGGDKLPPIRINVSLKGGKL